ncbi:SEED MATURATION PROTEIN 1 [Nymphaea colorata]|uniref:SEED MATURATION PROTEIN 1 n=1 Tax=Nymphaea colorata TaxID=210225 RepID=UPI00129E1243|nr:SEED MATURATION PROTEIN 1 [Nymphaea colorata]
MAKSKEDWKYAAAQAKVSEDEGLRTGYVAGTPLEAGKIADSEPVNLFPTASPQKPEQDRSQQLHQPGPHHEQQQHPSQTS